MARYALGRALQRHGRRGCRYLAQRLADDHVRVAVAVHVGEEEVEHPAQRRGLHVAARSPDEEYHFGYGKAEALSAAVVSLMLLAAAIGISIQAIRAIRIPHHLPASYTLVVLVIVMIVKEVLFRRVAAVGAEIDSTAVTADAQHHRADALTSLAAFAGISIALIGGEKYASADDYAALVAAGIILYSGVGLLRPAIADLMDRAPDRGLIRRVEDVACAVEGVCAVEKTLARRTGGG